MQIDKRSRAELKQYFVKNAIPTESNFAELIDGMLSQRDDGITKLPNDALCIEAVGDDASQKKALQFYGNFSDANPTWVLSLNPRQDPANAATAKAGLSFSDAAGISRLFIERGTGNVGVGTITPSGAKLQVAGTVKANRFTSDNTLVLNDYTTPNPSSNVYLFSPPNDRDAWLYLDSTATGNNWGIYHRQIDSPGGVKGLPANAIGFVGGGTSKLQAYVSLADGSAFFAGALMVNGALSAPAGLIFEGAVAHIERDGALYRNTDGQCYLTVDDHLYIRDIGSGGWAAHFDTNSGSLELKGTVRANRFTSDNTLVLNDYTTVNPASNVYLYSPPNDRDAWIYLDSADTGRNWGIYHRQIDNPTSVKGLPANSIAFIGGNQSNLQAYIGLADGSAFFAGKVNAAGYTQTAAGVNAPTMEIGGRDPVVDGSHGGILYLHDHGRVAHQLRYSNGTLFLEAAGNGYGTTPRPNLWIGGDVVIAGKNALRGNDAWLRLNQDGQFSSGVFTPGLLQADGGVRAREIGLGTQVHGPTTWPYETIQMHPGTNLRIWFGTTQRFVFENNGNFSAASAFLGSSDLYFTGTEHVHSGAGNAAGHAAIENAKDYDALMILGRAGTAVGRKVRLWDYLKVEGTLANLSDATTKQDIESLKYGLAEVKKLRPIAFNWIDRPNPHKSLGLVGQEVREVINEVAYDDDGKVSISYLNLIPVLINAIKELDGKIEALSSHHQDT